MNVMSITGKVMTVTAMNGEDVCIIPMAIGNVYIDRHR